MDPQPFRTYRIIAFDLLLLLFGISNIPSVIDRARLPVICASMGSKTVIASVESGPGVNMLQPGDVLIAWNDILIGRPEQVEFLGDRSRIGETIVVTLQRDGVLLKVPATLVAFASSLRFALVYGITGLVVLSLAMFLLLKRPLDPAARSLHRALIALGALVLLTQGALDVDDPLSYIRRAGLFTAYALTAAFFLEWTLRFPVLRFGGRRWPRRVLTSTAVAFALGLSWFHLHAMQDGSFGAFDVFQRLYEVFHLYFPLLIIAGLIVLSVGYFSEPDTDRRQALRWILWGSLVGATPFTVLVVLPQAFGPRFYLAEELATVFALGIPVSLTVAFLRYHVFDVQVTVYRRLASRILGIITGSLAVLASLVIVSIGREDLVFDDHFSVSLAIAVTMLLLQPARAKLRSLFEESLHPVRGALAQVLQRAGERFQAAMSPDQLGTSFVHELTISLPGLSFCWSRVEPDGRLSVMASPTQAREIVDLPPNVRSALRPRKVVARAGILKSGFAPEAPSIIQWLDQRSVDMAFGVHDESGMLLAVILVRRESKRELIAPEEVQAMLALSSLAAGSLARLHLQEIVFIEQQGRRRSDELNRQKSRFVSSVSHDLRTPLTSITMFAELMQNAALPPARVKEYAEIIERESRRLGRMVGNVLNFARIERGSREYDLRDIDLRPVIQRSVETMKAYASTVGGTITLTLPRRLPLVRGDADAIHDVLHNLVGNALKYSNPPRRVRVVVTVDHLWVTIHVHDNGIGIPSEHVGNIFDAFYRVKDARAAQTGGVGLGLAIVKHAVDAHQGAVNVESTVGKGTTVSISLPVIGGTKGLSE